MKNLLISAIIFFFILGSAIFLHTKLITICDTALLISDKIEISLSSEDFEEAYNESISLYSLINDKYTLISLYINHEEIDFLNTEVLELSQFTKTKNPSDALASLHTVKSSLVHLKEIEKLNIGNILFSNLKI